MDLLKRNMILCSLFVLQNIECVLSLSKYFHENISIKKYGLSFGQGTTSSCSGSRLSGELAIKLSNASVFLSH